LWKRLFNLYRSGHGVRDLDKPDARVPEGSMGESLGRQTADDTGMKFDSSTKMMIHGLLNEEITLAALFTIARSSRKSPHTNLSEDFIPIYLIVPIMKHAQIRIDISIDIKQLRCP
jgi:hypothetical protein